MHISTAAYNITSELAEFQTLSQSWYGIAYIDDERALCYRAECSCTRPERELFERFCSTFGASFIYAMRPILRGSLANQCCTCACLHFEHLPSIH